MEYLKTFIDGYHNFFSFVVKEITLSSSPWYINYFYALTLISVIVYLFEIIFPWRKNQKKIRKDFFLDIFYMYFNFFIFNLIIFGPFSDAVRKIFTDLNISSIALFDSSRLSYPVQILIFFLLLDFVQWATHVMLHRFEILWNFHKVHHSIREMGFAGHLRYHWMENVIYTPVKYIAVILIGGFEPANAFIVHYINILIGHLNHSNMNITYGPLKYVFNNPVMHLWHHVKYIKGRPYGVNYGISLSIWDFIFKTSYMEKGQRDLELGFRNIEKFPDGFLGQLIYPVNRRD